MTPEALAALHRLCFDAAPRPWTAAEFAAVADAPETLLLTRDGGLAVGRLAGPEAEILTLAVDPARRRIGTATALVADLEAAAATRGAREIFLEVAATNTAARALYERLGYRQAGLRPQYYAPGIDALVLVKFLAGPTGEQGKTI
jgi:ribosomal-protein-alanine N-acetyltransferase